MAGARITRINTENTRVDTGNTSVTTGNNRVNLNCSQVLQLIYHHICVKGSPGVAHESPKAGNFWRILADFMFLIRNDVS